MAINLTINGQEHAVEVDPETPLLWVIRDTIGLTGTKYGCGIALCGACTVHMDGEAVRSCSITAADAEGANVVTIEGLRGPTAEVVQATWRDLDVVQCGYCQSGQIMSAIALLNETPKPSDADINDVMDGNVCRCATYVRIRAAIHEASRRMEG